MIVQQQIKTATEFAGLWTALMPDLEPPDTNQFLLWVGSYSDELVGKGITRAACKARKLSGTETPMSAFDAMRYAASVMKNEFLGIRRHDPKGKEKHD